MIGRGCSSGDKESSRTSCSWPIPFFLFVLYRGGWRGYLIGLERTWAISLRGGSCCIWFRWWGTYLAWMGNGKSGSIREGIMEDGRIFGPYFCFFPFVFIYLIYLSYRFLLHWLLSSFSSFSSSSSSSSKQCWTRLGVYMYIPSTPSVDFAHNALVMSSRLSFEQWVRSVHIDTSYWCLAGPGNG